MRQSSLAAAVLLVFVVFDRLHAGAIAPEEMPKPSQFAPAADLLRQVDFYLARTSESLAEPARFDMAKQSRALKDAHTLAALALVLALHDEDFPQKPAMPALLRAAQQLAAAEGDYARAREALGRLQSARTGKVEPGGAARWERVAALGPLMKQVPLIHSQMKRGVDGARLARMAEQSSGQAAALAAIAQASMFDDEYAKTPADLEKWRQYCVEMRDAAGEVNAAIRAQDAPRVSGGMQRMLQSCEACHATFRHP
jgi:hypothetical protein